MPSKTAAPLRPEAPGPAGSHLSTPASLRRLYPYVRSALPQLLAGLLSALGASLVALAIPQVLRYVVDTYLTDVDAGASLSDLVWPIVLVLGLGLAEAGFILLRRTLVMFPGTRVESDMRMGLFRHLQDLPQAFHDRWPGGQLLSRIVGDLGMLRRWLVFSAIQLVVSVLTIIVGTVLLITTAGWLGLIYLAGAIPMTIIAFTFSRKFRVVARRSQEQLGELANTVEESVHGIRVLKAFGRGRDALRGFSGEAAQLRETELSKANTQSKLVQALQIIPESTLAIAMVVGAFLVANETITIGAFSAFFLTAAIMNGPVVDLGMTLAMTLNARTAVDRYFEILETPNSMADPEHPDEAGTPASDKGSHVRLRDVEFQYSDAAEPLLSHIDLDLPAGTTTALVGLTGSGKSTLAMLIPRIFDVTDGSVEIDGVSVRGMRRSDVRDGVAVAFEDPTLFSASVRENVLFGVDDALDHAEKERLMHEALEVAQAAFVYELPEGVDTKIGEEGLSLSGGQRQRLALARAIASRPRVLVLDDPLSALDVTTEEAVSRRLRQVLDGTTSLVIAHRPSTVALADRVAVLENGSIRAVGTHSELLATDAHYRYIISTLEEDAQEHGIGHFEDLPPAEGEADETDRSAGVDDEAKGARL